MERLVIHCDAAILPRFRLSYSIRVTFIIGNCHQHAFHLFSLLITFCSTIATLRIKLYNKRYLSIGNSSRFHDPAQCRQFSIIHNVMVILDKVFKPTDFIIRDHAMCIRFWVLFSKNNTFANNVCRMVTAHVKNWKNFRRYGQRNNEFKCMNLFSIENKREICWFFHLIHPKSHVGFDAENFADKLLCVFFTCTVLRGHRTNIWFSIGCLIIVLVSM